MVVKSHVEDHLLFFMRHFTNVLCCYSFILLILVYVGAIIDGNFVQNIFIQLTKIQWYFIVLLPPLLLTYTKTRKMPRMFTITNGWLKINYGKKIVSYDSSLYYVKIIPSTYKAEIFSLLFAAKQEIILVSQGVEIQIDCRLISKDDFSKIYECLEDDHRRKSAPTQMNVQKKKLDNVLFVARPTPNVFEDVYYKQRMKRQTIVFSIILMVLIGTAVIFSPLLSENSKTIGVVLIAVLSVYIFVLILHFVYDNQIPEDTLLEIEMTERIIILKKQAQIEIFRTEFIECINVTPVHDDITHDMRQVIFITTNNQEIEFEYTYGRESNTQVLALYARFLKQLEKIFKSKVEYLEK